MMNNMINKLWNWIKKWFSIQNESPKEEGVHILEFLGDNLPYDCLDNIVCFLSGKDMYNISTVSKYENSKLKSMSRNVKLSKTYSMKYLENVEFRNMINGITRGCGFGLDISSLNIYKYMDILNDVSNLTYLNMRIGGFHGDDDAYNPLNFIGNNKNLSYLDLEGCCYINDISPILLCPNLAYLNIGTTYLGASQLNMLKNTSLKNSLKKLVIYYEHRELEDPDERDFVLGDYNDHSDIPTTELVDDICIFFGMDTLAMWKEKWEEGREERERLEAEERLRRLEERERLKAEERLRRLEERKERKERERLEKEEYYRRHETTKEEEMMKNRARRNKNARLRSKKRKIYNMTIYEI